MEDDADLLDIPIDAHEMHVFNDQQEEEGDVEEERDEEPLPRQRERICAARQMLFRMFRRRVWRYQENAGIDGGEFPEIFRNPAVSENVKARLRQMFIRKNRLSPTRCIRIAREVGILPIEVCDFFLHLNYPTLHIDLNRRDPGRGRTFVYNVFVHFRVDVFEPGQARPPIRRHHNLFNNANQNV